MGESPPLRPRWDPPAGPLRHPPVAPWARRPGRHRVTARPPTAAPGRREVRVFAAAALEPDRGGVHPLRGLVRRSQLPVPPARRRLDRHDRFLLVALGHPRGRSPRLFLRHPELHRPADGLAPWGWRGETARGSHPLGLAPADAGTVSLPALGSLLELSGRDIEGADVPDLSTAPEPLPGPRLGGSPGEPGGPAGAAAVAMALDATRGVGGQGGGRAAADLSLSSEDVRPCTRRPA